MSGHTAEHKGNGAHAAAAAIANEAASKMEHIKAPLVQDKEVNFRFKKQKATDELGQEVKRPPVVLTIPVPTFEGLVTSLNDEKIQTYVLELVAEAIINQAREQVSDEDKPVNRQDELDTNKLTLEYIANIPKSERKGSGIAKEAWEEFEKDYVSVMVAKTDKGPDRAAKAAKILAGKFNSVRTDKAVIKFLQQQLAFWAVNTENLEDFQEIYSYLDDKATNLMRRDSQELLASL